jgi:hypothetical protein
MSLFQMVLLLGSLAFVGVVVGVHYGAHWGVAASAALYVLMPYRPQILKGDK